MHLAVELLFKIGERVSSRRINESDLTEFGSSWIFQVECSWQSHDSADILDMVRAKPAAQFFVQRLDLL